MKSFLFLHEVGHLLWEQYPELFAIYKSEVENATAAIEAHLNQLPPSEREALLSGQGFAQFAEVLEQQDCAQSELARDKKFVDECVADGHAVDAIMGQLAARDIPDPHIVAESIMALRLAMEIVRDIRVTTKCIAQEEWPPPSVSPAERMRATILRHRLVEAVWNSAQHRADQREVTDAFCGRYRLLFEGKTNKFDGISNSLIDLAFGRIRQFRDRMTKIPQLMGLDVDTPGMYRDKYLRNRYWSPDPG